jgi:hypothetical protein
VRSRGAPDAADRESVLRSGSNYSGRLGDECGSGAAPQNDFNGPSRLAFVQGGRRDDTDREARGGRTDLHKNEICARSSAG